MHLHKFAATGLAFAGLSLGLAHTAETANANPLLPATNLEFNVFSGTFTPPKDFFTHAQPTGWAIGAAAQIENLIYVGQQGSEGYFGPGPGNIYGVYGTFSNTVPPGTNFYQADGNPEFES